MTRRRLLSELGAGELDYWRAKEQIEPSGERRADLRAGLIAATIRNYNVIDNSEWKNAQDFIHEYPIKDEPERELTAEEIAAKIKATMRGVRPK